MTTYESIKLAIYGVVAVGGIIVSVWVNNTVQDLTAMMNSVNETLGHVEALVDMGPAKIAEVGDGVKQGVETASEGVKQGIETAGEGLGNATESWVEKLQRAKEAINDKPVE